VNLGIFRLPSLRMKPKLDTAAWKIARTSASSGRLREFAEAYSRAVALAEQIRTDDKAFRTHAKWLIGFGFQTADTERAFRDMDRALSLGVPIDPNLNQLVTSFGKDHAILLGKTRQLVVAAGAGKPPVANADFQLHGWLKFLDPFKSPSIHIRRTWMTVTSEAARIAQEEGLSTVLIPDFLVPLTRGKQPRHVLSFHTEGVRPGLTHFKPADIPGYAWIDSHGYAGWSSLARCELSSLDLPPLAVAEQFFVQHSQEILAGNISKQAQPEARGEIDLPEQYVFVAMQLTTDRSQQLARIPMLEMLNIVVARFRGTPIKVVVKRHPRCSNQAVQQRLASLAKNGDIILRVDSIHQLIARSLAVITVNSGVGSEAILHLKPIYLFGKADYACVAHNIESAKHFNTATCPIRLAVSAEAMKKFLCYYRKDFLVQISDRERLQSVIYSRVLNRRRAFAECTPPPPRPDSQGIVALKNS
jgi:Capsule polysaccharide biosynthesis protein